MAALDVQQKLAILADAAKYDASCASSGTTKRDSAGGKGIGSTEGMGICHAYAPDGRCISLLKILLTNACIFDCHYCINRKSSNVRRARFTVEEVVRLTLAFYRRNYIEGLFLSSGIIRSPDYTMERIVEVARSLREDHDFRGYIHLKTIPDADPELVRQAGLHADRVSINVELPTARRPRPARAGEGRRPDRGRDERDEDGDRRRRTTRKARYKSAPAYAPAGQSTQMIVGADAATDAAIVARAAALYDRLRLRRVYYSAFSPIPDASAVLPLVRPPLMREHRLYQADWMMRFYGYSAREVAALRQQRATSARHRSQARLGPQASRFLPARRQPRPARGAAAHPRPRRAGGRPNPRRAPPSPASARRRRPADRLGSQSSARS